MLDWSLPSRKEERGGQYFVIMGIPVKYASPGYPGFPMLLDPFGQCLYGASKPVIGVCTLRFSSDREPNFRPRAAGGRLKLALLPGNHEKRRRVKNSIEQIGLSLQLVTVP